MPRKSWVAPPADAAPEKPAAKPKPKPAKKPKRGDPFLANPRPAKKGRPWLEPRPEWLKQ